MLQTIPFIIQNCVYSMPLCIPSYDSTNVKYFKTIILNIVKF